MCSTVEAKDKTAESICLTIKWDHAEQEERFCQLVPENIGLNSKGRKKQHRSFKGKY